MQVGPAAAAWTAGPPAAAAERKSALSARNPNTPRRVRLQVPAPATPVPVEALDLPNVLTLLKRPRASLPPVDFRILAAPVILSKPQPPSPRPSTSVSSRSSSSRWHAGGGGGGGSPSRGGGSPSRGSASARPAGRGGLSILERSTLRIPYFDDDDELIAADAATLLPQSARVQLRTRRRMAAMGEGAHSLEVHALMRKGSAGRAGSAAGGSDSASRTRPSSVGGSMPITSLLSASFRRLRAPGGVGGDGRPHSPPRLANIGALFGHPSSQQPSGYGGHRPAVPQRPHPPHSGLSRGSACSGSRPGTGSGSRPTSRGSGRSLRQPPARPSTAATDVEGGAASGLDGTDPPPMAADALTGEAEEAEEEAQEEAQEAEEAGAEAEEAEEAEEAGAEAEEAARPVAKGLEGRTVKYVRGKAAGERAKRGLERTLKATGMPVGLVESMRENVRGSLAEKLQDDQRESEAREAEEEEEEEEEDKKASEEEAAAAAMAEEEEEDSDHEAADDEAADDDETHEAAAEDVGGDAALDVALDVALAAQQEAQSDKREAEGAAAEVPQADDAAGDDGEAAEQPNALAALSPRPPNVFVTETVPGEDLHVEEG